MIDRYKYGIYFYSCFILFFLIRIWNRLTLCQLGNNPIRSPRIDPMVWLYQHTPFPDLFSSGWPTYIFDGLVGLLPFYILYQLVKGRHPRGLIIVHAVLFALYVLTIYCYPTLSIRKYLGLVLIPVAFMMTTEKRYANTISILRYYVCFIFTSASFWKITRGILTERDQMILTLKAQHIDNIVYFPDHFISRFVLWIINHPTVAHSLLIAAVITQLFFGLGFFTKKWDRLLGLFLLIFILSDYLIMRIEYWEFVVFLPLFFVWKKVNR